MGNNNKKLGLSSLGGLVYSTNPEAIQPEEITPIETLAPNQQRLRVRIEKKQRGGKVVTLIDDFEGNEDDLTALGKQLKTKCGTGGSVKDGQILIQGDYREKIIQWLKDWGYTQTK